MNTQTETDLSQVFDFLEAGEVDRAKPLIGEALSSDLENGDIEFLLRCANFWIRKIPAHGDSGEDKLAVGETLIRQWKEFLAFADEKVTGVSSEMRERVQGALCRGVFSSALDCFLALLRAHQVQQKSEVYLRIGECYKKLGQYEDALANLIEANTLAPDQAGILAEMADCSALCGKERDAKLLFREAFFVDPGKVELDFLDSGMIHRLVDLVEEKGFSGAALLEWLPVYGKLYGVFTILREMKALEAGKLKQAIYALETNLKEPGADRAVKVPRLINHYFWLVDYLTMKQEDRGKIDETLLKIKLLDEGIYKRYTGTD
jgi:tetratricopeptide (TPR) repeat protein